MRHTRSYLNLAAAVALLLLVACGGGGAEGDTDPPPPPPPPPPPVNILPTANAGAPQTVYGGVLVTLNGTASSDADGSIATYAWTQVSGPAVVLSNSAAAQPNFTAPPGAATALGFTLVVLDNQGGSSSAAAVTITVNANMAPVASASVPATVTAGEVITLEGSSSNDSDGNIVAYFWAQSAGPAVPVLNATSPQGTFTVRVASVGSTLKFVLVVTDNRGATGTTTVTINVNPNTPPVANAGPPQTVNSGDLVILDSSHSSDLEGGAPLVFAWTQIAGPAVTLDLFVPSRPKFTAPAVSASTTLTFRVVATDFFGALSAPATVNITVNPAGTGIVNISGVVRFERVPFQQFAPFGLDYANPVLQPARGVTVRLLKGSSGSTELASGTTDANGGYSFDVTADTSVRIQVVARMTRGFTQPSWDVRVQDGDLGGSIYSYDSATINSSLGVLDVNIPTGISASGAATGARASGAFAILDTIYSAFQTIIAGGGPLSPLNSTISIDWGQQTEGKFFRLHPAGFVPQIKLLANLAGDSDEFDQHVIAREFGKYLQFAYSRSDALGGSHASGDRLDMREAFSEGFGHAFAAIARNDPVFRDSAVVGGTRTSTSINLETNPPDLAGADAACWCNAASVWSLLWDLYDSAPDGVDNVSLGFTPLWSVMNNAQKTTESATSIFSFMAGLKAAQPAQAGDIDALLAAQNINPVGLDAFASTQITAPFSGMAPLFADITLNGPPVIVRSSDDGGRHNKAGNHAFLRFTAAANATVRVVVTTSNPAANADPDFIVYRGSPDGVSFGGGPFVIAESKTPQPESGDVPAAAGKTYVIDAYDCANGCSVAQGTPGDYDLTVTLSSVP